MRSRAFLACVLLGACSFTVGGPPSNYRPRRFTPPPDCTESFAGRILLDLTGIAASLFIATFAYGACFAHETDCTHPDRAAPYVGLAALYAAGIGYGVITTERCTRARALHAAVQGGLELDE